MFGQPYDTSIHINRCQVLQIIPQQRESWSHAFGRHPPYLSFDVLGLRPTMACHQPFKTHLRHKKRVSFFVEKPRVDAIQSSTGLLERSTRFRCRRSEVWVDESYPEVSSNPFQGTRFSPQDVDEERDRNLQNQTQPTYPSSLIPVPCDP